MTRFTTDGDIPERAVGTAIAEKTLQQARGHHQEFCVAEQPRRAYYISNLTPPEATDDEEDEYIEETGDEDDEDDDSTPISEIRPNSIGLDFQPVNDEFPVRIQFEVYYQTHPTFDEYQQLTSDDPREVDAAFGLSNESDTSAIEEGVAEETEPIKTPENAYGLDVPFYRRVDVEVYGTIQRNSLKHDAAALTRELQDELRRQLRNKAKKTPPTQGTLDPSNFDQDLSDLPEVEFNSKLNHLLKEDPDILTWPIEFTAEEIGSEIRFRLQLNSFGERFELPSEENRPELVWDPERAEIEPSEECVFNPVIETSATLQPYELDLMPEDYRFDQRVWAKGHNCSTHTKPADGSTELKERTDSVIEFQFQTTAVPTAPVYEFEYRNEYDSDIDTRFLTLADAAGKGTIDTLRDIAEGMEAYHRDWVMTRKEKFAQTHTSEEVEAFEEDAHIFDEIEIERFREGIEMLDNDEEALRAFRLMNRVNHRVHAELPDDGGFDRWRLFQLVFIVSNLQDIVARDPDPDREKYETKFADHADVLWFPTGGGKTEAYVGLILFTLFFDRLRGKDRGVSAWLRFPLRLLSSQQKSRFLKALLVAEQFRARENNPEDGILGLDDRGDQFSLGYFVGSQDTPNRIGNDQRKLFQNSQDELERQCRVLTICPLCNSDIEVRFDETRNLVEHYCTGDDCVGRLPLYVTDNDVYRYLPSVLLGSLDKIAIMGFQPRFANIFGNLTTECTVHGLGYSSKCAEKDVCKEPNSLSDATPGTRADRDAPYFDPIPSLHLVDEVHLLNEELGTYAGHYETAYLELCELASEWQDRDQPDVDSGVKPKVLTSTATIAKYERQMWNLFHKDAVRFPQEGPALRETYYGKLHESKVEREYAGVTPNNRTHLYAILDFVKRYHEIIRDYYDGDREDLIRDAIRMYHQLRPDAAPDLDPTDDADLDELVSRISWPQEFTDKEAVLDKCETSLVYFTNKREKDVFRKNIGKQIADEMEEEGYDQRIESEQLTADTQGTGVLDELLDPPDQFDKRPDTIPCTSFVGHGIDNPRFNFMIFFGYPSQTFQYIQASSRVGRQRDIPGFVMDFFRPFDLRDRHRYKYFETLHKHLGRTVEPVAIDRWAKFGAEQTHPGIVKAIIRQYYRPKYYWHETDGEFTTIEGRSGDEERINVEKASHFYELMYGPYPDVSRENLTDLVFRLYSIDDADRPIDNIESMLQEKTDRIWQLWSQQLNREMSTPEFPGNEGPMQNLRDIGEDGEVSPFDNSADFINALLRGEN